MNRLQFATQTSGLAPAPASGGHTASILPRPTLSPDLNRMLSAAAVSVRFRQQLLADPVAALTAGYNGEGFNILPDELSQLLAIHANTLAEFAAELLERLWHHRLDEGRKSKQEALSGDATPAPLPHEEPIRHRATPTDARRRRPRPS